VFDPLRNGLNALEFVSGKLIILSIRAVMSKIIEFDACDNCYYALKNNGEVIAWGENGIVPEPSTGYRYMPTDMGSVKNILCMPNTVFSIDSSDTVRGWGLNENALLDIPAGLKAKALFSSNRKSVAAINMDDSVVIWGSAGAEILSGMPADLKAKKVALYDVFALAINLEDRVVAWGQLPEGFLIPANLGPVRSVCSNGTATVAIKDTGYPTGWKIPGYGGVATYPPVYAYHPLKSIDCYGDFYGLVDHVNILKIWTFNDAGLISPVYTDVKKVSSFRFGRGADSKPQCCIIHKNGLVSVMSRVKVYIPAPFANYSARSSMLITVVNPSTPYPIPTVPSIPAAEQVEEAARSDILQDAVVVNPQPTEKEVLIKSVYIGSDVAAALTEDNTILTWGSYNPPEASAARGVKALACGLNSFHYIGSDDKVKILSEATGIVNIDVKARLIFSSTDDESILLNKDDNSILAYGATTAQRGIGPSNADGYISIQKTPLYTLCLMKNNHIKIYGRSANVANIPKPDDATQAMRFSQISGSSNTCIGIDLEGNLLGWSSSSFLGADVLPEGAIKKAKFVTSYGNGHAIIKPDDTLAVWSYNDDYEIVVNEEVPRRLKAKYVTINEFGIAVVTLLGKVVVFSNRYNLKSVPASILGGITEDATRYLPALPYSSKVLQLATGKGFTMALLKNLTVVAWGDTKRSLMNIPAVSAKFIATGDGVAGLIKLDDTYVSWGENASNELADLKVKKVILCKSGLALTVNGDVIVFGLPADLRAKYAVPAGLNNVMNISFLEFGEKRRYAALKNDLTVAVWGDDVVPVPGNAVRVSVGKNAIIVLRKNGVVEGYGTNDHKELNIPGQLRAKDIFTGDACFALQARNNSFGNWGQDIKETEAYENSVNWITKGHGFGNRKNDVSYMVYNGNHFAVVNIDGLVVLWGANDKNECFVPPILKNTAAPVTVGGTITGLALTWYYGCALIHGAVRVWGGQVDTPEQRLANLPLFTDTENIKQVALSGNTWFSLSDSGRVSFWNLERIEDATFNALTAITKHNDYDKISVSQDIIIGLIKGSGKVRAYGKRGYSIQNLPASVKVGGIKDVFAGPTCAMAITGTDDLVIWGKKYNPCLNPPADLGKVKSVMCSDTYGLAILLDGTLRVWGGLSTVALAALVKEVPSGKFKTVSMASNHYIGIKEDNTVVEWGGSHLSDDYVMPPGLKATLVYTSAPAGFSAAVNMEGELVVWGGTDRIGNALPLENWVTEATAQEQPKEEKVKKYSAVKNVSVQTAVYSENPVMSIVSGPKQVGIIDTNGHVVTWGKNEFEVHFIPRHLEGVDFLCIGPEACVARNSVGQYVFWGHVSPGSDINFLPDDLDCKKMVLTEYIGMAINEDDRLLKWGRTPGVAEGKDDTDLPEGLTKVRDVAAYGFNLIAADLEGQIHLWGTGKPVKYDSEKKAKAVSVGRRHYAAILEDSSVISWGESNEYKQQDVPVGLKAKAIACGYHFTAAIDLTDKVVVWGFPKACTEVPADLKAVSISCGIKHVVALKEDGTYVIWGHNIYDTIKLAPSEVFVSPSVTLEQVTRYDFRRDFQVPTKYTLNRKQVKEVARNDKVFDMVLHKAGRNLVDFLMEHQGNAVIFRYNGEQTATLKSAIEAGFKEKGDSYRVNVFYECVGRHVMEDAGHGTFDFPDIYRKPYYQLNLANGTYLITMEDLERVFKQNQFWILQDTGIELKYTASYWSVVAGGPLVSANHCQDGTAKKLFMLVPFSIISEEEDDEEEVPQNVVKVKLGEEVTEIDITDSKRVLDVKTKYATLKGLAKERLKFVAGGKILGDDSSVMPGFVIQVLVAPAGGDLKVRRVRKSRKN